MAGSLRAGGRREQEEGCVFRYRLSEAPRREPLHADRLAELIRQQLCNLLDIAVPQKNGEDVAVDSFRFLAESKPRALFPREAAENPRHARDAAEEEPGSGASRREVPRDGSPETASIVEKCEGGVREKTAFVEGREGASRGEDSPNGRGGREAPGRPAYRSLANAALYEPRVEFIARQLASLLSVVELEWEGKTAKVDGFRLRDLDDWTGPHASATADLFQHAATRCQFDCVFCYNRGGPPSLASDAADAEEEWRELSDRLARYEPRSGTGLFPTFGGPREVLAHPHALRLLREVRERTDEPIRLSTNGGALDRRCIAALAELRPLFLDLSLHSSSPSRRAMLMRDPHPEKAVAALPALSEAGIPYAVTIVAWPLPSLEEMLSDLRATVLYAAASGARMVQVNLPGFSRFFSPTPPFDTAKVWPEIVREVGKLRELSDCPVFLSPAMYEENLTRRDKNRAEVVGVVRGSPAARAGLAAGDLLTAVNGTGARNRPQARDLLALVQAADAGEFTLTVRRGGGDIELTGDTRDFSYPYDPQTAAHLGAVFMGSGFRASHLDEVQAAVHARGARRPLLLTSALVRPTLEQLLRERPLSLPGGCRLALGVPENRYFGGNIILGDLLVVDDFVAFIREYAARGGEGPDLVLIPSSPFRLSGWGRDLTGRPYLDIERRTGIAVELLRCETIWE
ncbi:MAG: radical SAM protein [Actinomycetota bacterium]|nr:radical SAM protein [Actinomycetota bacterium]